MLAMRSPPQPVLELVHDQVSACTQRYSGWGAGIDMQRIVDACHFVSAGVVSFARGLNDTPKIAALLLMLRWSTPARNVFFVGVAIAIGGMLCARRVAETISHKITSMNPGQGLTSNLATAMLVLLASFQGLPVSTTHVAAGSMFGIGLATRQANAHTIVGIALSWVVTLPCAAALSAAAYLAHSALAA